MQKIILALLLGILPINLSAKENTMDKALVVYFSRTGDQYSVGEITKGNTEIIAEMITSKTGADLFEIKLKNDTYPKEYKALTDVAGEEKNNNARPEIASDVDNFDQYKTIFVGGPVWWSDLPMVMYTFIEKHDWTGKTIIPFVTHEGSGLSAIPRNLKQATNATMLEGLAIYGHEAQNDRDNAQSKVNDWLKKIGY